MGAYRGPSQRRLLLQTCPPANPCLVSVIIATVTQQLPYYALCRLLVAAQAG